jgi:hypothetical protein
VRIDKENYLEIWDDKFVVGFKGAEPVIRNLYDAIKHVEVYSEPLVVTLKTPTTPTKKIRAIFVPTKHIETIYNYLKQQDGEVDSEQVAKATNINITIVRRALRQLAEDGVLTKRKQSLKRGGCKYFYQFIDRKYFNKQANLERKTFREILD